MTKFADHMIKIFKKVIGVFFSKMEDGSFQNKVHMVPESKHHFWQIDPRDQTCLLVRTQTCLLSA